MTVYVAAFLFVFGVTVDVLVVRAFYRRIREFIRCRRPARNLRERIAAYTIGDRGSASPVVMLSLVTLAVIGYVAFVIARNAMRVVAGL